MPISQWSEGSCFKLRLDRVAGGQTVAQIFKDFPSRTRFMGLPPPLPLRAAVSFLKVPAAGSPGSLRLWSQEMPHMVTHPTGALTVTTKIGNVLSVCEFLLSL